MNPQTNHFANPQRPGQAPPQTTAQQLSGQRQAMQNPNLMPTNVSGAAIAPSSNPLPTPEPAPMAPPAPAAPSVPQAVATPPAPKPSVPPSPLPLPKSSKTPFRLKLLL